MSDQTIRADRLLANLGYASRKEAGKLIRRGFLEIDGVAIASPEEKLSLHQLRTSRALFDGAPLDPRPPLIILLHKPAGYECSRAGNGPVVFDLLPQRFNLRNPKLSVAGRLDVESTGLVLLSDDGHFVHKIISPNSHTPKTYIVTTEEPVTEETCTLFRSGAMMLKGEKKPLQPVEIEILAPCKVKMVLHEGRHRQIRRMFASYGNRVETLHRICIGAYELSSLQEGCYRILDATQQFTDIH